MGFTELSFLFLFLPAFLISYLLCHYLQERFDKYVLVFFSIVFYVWAGSNTLMLFLALILIAYAFGRFIKNSEENGRKKSTILAIAVTIFVVILLMYKYVPFMFQQIASNENPMLHNIFSALIAPIGLSFITFSAISYVVDIYRGKAKAGTLLDTLLFFSLFPKLVSGPIVQWKDFRPQLDSRVISLESVCIGIDRIIIGLAKKAVIADSFGVQIARINAEISGAGVDTQTMWIRALLFFFELYFDFAGYSDIAIGICEIMGFSVKDNFNYPYLSKSVSEFWRRWHISLGSWFREYVYIPLGGSRSGNVYINLFIVFLLTGIWHGSNWTYLAWGVLNGLVVIVERVIRNRHWYQSVPNICKWLTTITFVFFAWIVFGASDMPDAINTFRVMFSGAHSDNLTFTWQYFLNRKMIVLLLLSFAGAFGLFRRIGVLFEKKSTGEALFVIKRIMYLSLFIVDIVFIASSSYSPFLYFQF